MRMNIIIDSREKGRRERASTYYTNKGHKANVETLDVGDYLFDDQVVFEYKIMSDFMSSVLNGRNPCFSGLFLAIIIDDAQEVTFFLSQSLF